MSQNSFHRQCDVLIIFKLVDWIAIFRNPPQSPFRKGGGKNPPRYPFRKGRGNDPPLKKGEDVVLPFFKGELEGIF
jgi:hypothetical protein